MGRGLGRRLVMWVWGKGEGVWAGIEEVHSVGRGLRRCVVWRG
jgi:hypothetical protein